MAVSLLTYVITFFVFICNYALTITSLALPKWLTFVTPVPFYMETNYGLFRLCRSFTRECRVFPSNDYGDCSEDGFCELWRAASAGMLVSAILGALAIVALIGTMCSSRRKRAKAWVTVAGLFALHAIPQAFSMGVMAYLFNHSATFYMGTRYDVSFILCTISWCLSIFLAVLLSLIAVLSPPEYSYQPLN
ncbi:uncharacterized protein BYT42DRAFT_645723 [Radiomyces spectabilis]|uniref:uncharacterized protein n=1 Tax=Radiomyces spectabilis TaxID=64574 RepID=UPI00221F5648|nr:uncharacterized protein BYT42DRAFT_645723 [Radiomyces spectabilis]KAI8376054.1 hypothetical protein BYT42DRAFT_645723 [Radiomyces spectabilis]